ncbi:MAG: hypothetical protein IPK14_21080 [Blastocatellia bacterium]|nr:hypothetical protein [Blastocatellia bacterium]MBL8197255.1 hypothetical protein [Blastocatellia bacterium]MBN8722092.1 hypothetical protein [Acidobacteriota bacterium]
MGKEGTNKTSGAKCWIRLRGSPNDPESFELAAWTGIAWEIPAKTNDGRIVVLSIPDYMVAETLPAETDPEKLYHPLKVA